jgi:hypothetical protein
MNGTAYFPSPFKGEGRGETGVSASMLAAGRAVARCNGQRALQVGVRWWRIK